LFLSSMITKLSAALLLLIAFTGTVNSFSCPAQNGIYASPGDCAAFFKCYRGQAREFKCPAGLLFNALAQVCDWAANVNCKAGPIKTTSRPRPQTTTRRQPGPNNLTPAPFPDNQPADGCSGKTSEPINQEIRKLRKLTCMASNSVVDKVSPGNPGNPSNVKVLESVFSKRDFKKTFPRANGAYTYENFLKAFAKFPEVCRSAEVCKRTLAAMFAHFEQETAGLKYLKEINKSPYCATWNSWIQKAYPCIPGQMYFGRGAKQLSWNYNYGAFSNAMFGDAKVLLKNPDMVSDTWLNFASALWFYITPQPPKPSMLAVVDQSWQPNANDLAANRKPGFGATIMIINGAQECGPSPPNANGSRNRQREYKKYAKMFGIDISGEKLDCADMKAFDATGSSNPAIYWSPPSCTLNKWQTAYSALVEGDYKRCKAGN